VSALNAKLNLERKDSNTVQ